jgi:hypothetical protein
MAAARSCASGACTAASGRGGYERYSLFLLAGAWRKRLIDVWLLREINAPLLSERS